MVDIVRQPVLAPRLPWRAIGFGFVLLALLVALIAALVVGAPRSLPKPFGLARSGLITYESGGDIYTVDPASGRSTAIVRGGTALGPRWSRDGMHLAFERTAGGGSGADRVYVADADGSDPILVTPQPLANITDYQFSPDGTRLLVSADAAGAPGLYIAKTDGSGARQLDVGGPASNASWRPPDGSEILFMDAGNDTDGYGAIHLVSAQGGTVRTILADDSASGHYRGHPQWSPDGSLISYGEWCDTDCSTGKALPADAGLTVETNIIRADGAPVRTLPMPPGAVWQSPESWSNDGTRMLVIRGYSPGVGDARPAVIPVDGSGTGIEILYPGGMSPTLTLAWEWAPDDSSILGTPIDASGAQLDQVLLDLVTRSAQKVPWTSVSRPSWQRLGP